MLHVRCYPELKTDLSPLANTFCKPLVSTVRRQPISPTPKAVSHIHFARTARFPNTNQTRNWCVLSPKTSNSNAFADSGLSSGTAGKTTATTSSVSLPRVTTTLPASNSRRPTTRSVPVRLPHLHFVPHAYPGSPLPRLLFLR